MGLVVLLVVVLPHGKKESNQQAAATPPPPRLESAVPMLPETKPPASKPPSIALKQGDIPPKKLPAKGGPNINLTSEELYKEFKANGGATIKKYHGATIVMSGTVVDIGGEHNRGFLSLNAVAKEDFPGVACLVPGEFEVWARYAPDKRSN